MKITMKNEMSNQQLISLLNENEIKAVEKSLLFGKQITIEENESSFTVKTKKKVLTLDVFAPRWVRIVGGLGALVVVSILMSMIYGQLVIAKGGVLFILALYGGSFISEKLYKAPKENDLKLMFEKINKLIG
jgi:lipopolysaccharide/colanic/teichoic acid biosynthesis glycosyltransferase